MPIESIIHKYRTIFGQPSYPKMSYEESAQLRKEYVTALREVPDQVAVSEIQAKLDELVSDPIWRNIHDWILAAQQHPSTEYIPSLISILDIQEMIWTEGIIHVFLRAPDKRAIPALARALDFVKSADESRELAKLAMEALVTINTPEAREIVRQRVNDPDEFVSEFAEDMVEYMDQHPPSTE